MTQRTTESRDFFEGTFSGEFGTIEVQRQRRWFDVDTGEQVGSAELHRGVIDYPEFNPETDPPGLDPLDRQFFQRFGVDMPASMKAARAAFVDDDMHERWTAARANSGHGGRVDEIPS